MVDKEAVMVVVILLGVVVWFSIPPLLSTVMAPSVRNSQWWPL
jgi:hypothetical protein